MAKLCEYCIKRHRSTCDLQEKWNEQEKKLTEARTKVQKLFDDSEQTDDIKLVFETTKDNMHTRRSIGALRYKAEALRRKCTRLEILPLAE